MSEGGQGRAPRGGEKSLDRSQHSGANAICRKQLDVGTGPKSISGGDRGQRAYWHGNDNADAGSSALGLEWLLSARGDVIYQGAGKDRAKQLVPGVTARGNKQDWGGFPKPCGKSSPRSSPGQAPSAAPTGKHFFQNVQWTQLSNCIFH